jgi:long-chain acyl-CoA synthetase
VSSPSVLSDITTARTLGEVALGAARRHKGVALRKPGSPDVGYEELGRTVREIAGGLATLGVEPGDRVGILGGTVPEWTLADFGALCSGATVVPVYHTNSPEECEYVLSHAGVKVLFVEDAAQAAKIAKVRGNLPELEQVIVGRPGARIASPE